LQKETNFEEGSKTREGPRVTLSGENPRPKKQKRERRDILRREREKKTKVATPMRGITLQKNMNGPGKGVSWSSKKKKKGAPRGNTSPGKYTKKKTLQKKIAFCESLC